MEYYGIWANNIKDTLPNFPNQQTYSINFIEDNLLEINTLLSFEQKLSINTSSKINLKIIDNTENNTFIKKILEEYLLKSMPNIIDNDNYLSHKLIITLTIESQCLITNLLLNGKQHSFKTNEFEYSYLADLISLPNSDRPIFFRECLFYIIHLTRKYFPDSYMELTYKILSGSPQLLKLLDFTLFLEFLLDCDVLKSRGAIKDIGLLLIDNNEFNLLQVINLASNHLQVQGGELYVSLYQELLEKGIDKTNDLTLKATLSYNKANSLKCQNDSYKALFYYNQARKYDPDYLNRPYWWRELGGTLFMNNKFKCAEKSYKEALKLDINDYPPLIYFFIGDSLFFQGKFSESLIYMGKFFEHNVEDDKKIIEDTSEMFLKSGLCRFYIEEGLDSSQINTVESNRLIHEFCQINKLELLDSAIKANPLNANAWFNKSMYLNGLESREKNISIILNGFITSVCINPLDSEAWMQAIIICLQELESEPIMVLAIYQRFRAVFRNDSVNILFQELSSYVNFSSTEEKEKYMKIILYLDNHLCDNELVVIS